MSETFHGLRCRPFPATPDLLCYYPATSHERALARLRQGLAGGEGVMVLVGAPGTGKTLLAHALLDQIGSDVNTAFLTHGSYTTRAGLLQAVLYDLHLPHEGPSADALRLQFTDAVLRQFAEGKRTLVLIDEAHHLGVEALEELRLWGNLEGRAGRAVQVVLIGLPHLHDTLLRPELTSLRQRVAVRTQVEPLGLQEAADYLLHHLRIAGGQPEELLTDEVIEVLARATEGVPRLLNQVGYLTLQLAADNGVGADLEVALEALGSLGLPTELPAEPGIEPGAIGEGEPLPIGEEGFGSEAPLLYLKAGKLA